MAPARRKSLPPLNGFGKMKKCFRLIVRLPGVCRFSMAPADRQNRSMTRRCLQFAFLTLFTSLGVLSVVHYRDSSPASAGEPKSIPISVLTYDKGRPPVPEDALLRLPRQRQGEGGPVVRQVHRRRVGRWRTARCGTTSGTCSRRGRCRRRSARSRSRPTSKRSSKAIQAIFDRADAAAKPNAGRVTIRRLNRTEYNNTIRDLVGVDFKPADDFPADDVGYGFDNIGDVLSVSPLLLEKYLAAAETILDQAIVIADPPKLDEADASTRIRTGSTSDRRGAGQDPSRSRRATTRSGARSPASSSATSRCAVMLRRARRGREGRSRSRRRPTSPTMIEAKSGVKPGTGRVGVALPEPVAGQGRRSRECCT